MTPNKDDSKRLGLLAYFHTLNKIRNNPAPEELSKIAGSLGYRDLQRYFNNPSKAPDKLNTMIHLLEFRLWRDYAPIELKS